MTTNDDARRAAALREQAEALIPVLAGRAAETEALRRLPDETVADVKAISSVTSIHSPPPPHDAVEGRHALLSVQQQLDDAGDDRSVSAMGRGHGFRHPHQETAYGMTTIQGAEQAPHLIARFQT